MKVIVCLSIWFLGGKFWTMKFKIADLCIYNRDGHVTLIIKENLSNYHRGQIYCIYCQILCPDNYSTLRYALWKDLIKYV